MPKVFLIQSYMSYRNYIAAGVMYEAKQPRPFQLDLNFINTYEIE